MNFEKIGSHMTSAWELVGNYTAKAGNYISDTAQWLKDSSSLDKLQALASTISACALKLIKENQIVVGTAAIGVGTILLARGICREARNQGRAGAINIAGGTGLIAYGVAATLAGVTEAMKTATA